MSKKEADEKGGGSVAEAKVADEAAEPAKKTWRKVLLIILMVILNVVVIASAAVSEFGNSEEAAELREVRLNWWLLIPATLCFVVAITAEIYKYVLMMRKLSSEKSKERNDWKIARRTVLLGRYYDNITPAAVGGQPFQVYYMRKHSGMSRGASTAVPMFGMVSLQIAFIMIALVCFLFGGLAGDYPALIVTAWIGLAFYAFWPTVVVGASFFPDFTTKVISWLVKLLATLHIIKKEKRAETLKKVEKEITEYANSIKFILKTRGLFLKAVGLSLLFNILMAMIPFFVLTAFGGDMNFWSCFGTTIAVMSAIYFIPTPGNTGAAEGTFFLVFSALSSGYVFWAMLVWRLFSYYIYVIMGPVIYLDMHLEKNGKKRGASKKVKRK